MLEEKLVEFGSIGGVAGNVGHSPPQELGSQEKLTRILIKSGPRCDISCLESSISSKNELCFILSTLLYGQS